MAKERSDKSRYPSRYSPKGWVTGAQYIAEILCENKARKENKELPTKFWELDEWAKFYKSQVYTAYALVKQYRPEAIISVLKDPKQRNTYSLRAPWLSKLFDAAHKQIILREQQAEQQAQERKDRDVNITVGTNERPEMKKRDRLSALEGL